MLPRRKPPASSEDQAQRERSLRLVATWTQGFGRLLAAREGAATVAESHEAFCECIACRAHAGDQSALRDMLDGLDSASP